GGFEAYCNTIGGILQCAGIDGFLGSMEDFYDASDLEGEVLRSLVSVWWQEFQDKEVGVAQLYPLVDKYEIPLDLGNSGSDRGQKTRFGKLLGSLRDRQLGNYRISAGRSKDRAQQYRLLAVAESLITIAEDMNELQDKIESHPQPDILSGNNPGAQKCAECAYEAEKSELPSDCPKNTEEVNPTVEPIPKAARYTWTDVIAEMVEQ
ncbi:MAG: hypothetical protein ABSH41_09155, partial [Syntrophobacteraceae bacterium]